ncbi:MAG: LamG-like jellyroll fold domain-containing protein, partial [Verrucomicrobiota bacterium]
MTRQTDNLVPGADFTAGEDLMIGARINGGFAFDGQIDDVALWKRALSGEEIATLYEAGLSGRGALDEPEVVVEGPLLVELDAADLALGPITTWENAGGLGGSFAASGDPMVEVIDGVTGVTLDGDGDYFEGPVTTASLEGNNPRSIIAWVYNPELASEETVISWGKRGGPDGTNMSFNHGFHNNFGAVGHWGGGGPDIGWNPASMEEGDDPGVLGDAQQATWTHISYTQTGSYTKVFTNGRLSNEEEADLNTHGGLGILVGAQREADGVAVTGGLKGSLTIASVSVYEGALSDADILADYEATKDGFPDSGGVVTIGTLPADSDADFGGPEVDNGWVYGYRNVPLDNRTDDYDPVADFIPFPDDWWTGNAWDEPNADGDNVPWTVISNDNGHPNGDNNGELHWAIRRFIAPGGPTEINWSLAKQNVNCGNGVTGAVHINGVRVDRATIASDDGDGVNRTVNVNLEEGDFVDLILSPLGTDDTDNDGCDGSFFGMTVEVDDPGVVVEGPLLVELDATDLTVGPITAWENAGGLGGSFAASGDPMVEVIDGVTGVTFDGEGDYFEGPVTTASLEGSSPRSIIAWVYNPELASEETVISWGRRGGPDGTNMSFNHGFHNNFGAVGHWGGGGPDIGWNPNTQVEDEEPNVPGDAEAGIWTHIAYTQTGSNTKVFTNGVLTNEEAADLDTHAGTAILVGAQREPNGTDVTGGLKGSLTIGNVRIFEGALADADIQADFEATAEK